MLLYFYPLMRLVVVVRHEPKCTLRTCIVTPVSFHQISNGNILLLKLVQDTPSFRGQKPTVEGAGNTLKHQ